MSGIFWPDKNRDMWCKQRRSKPRGKLISFVGETLTRSRFRQQPIGDNVRLFWHLTPHYFAIAPSETPVGIGSIYPVAKLQASFYPISRLAWHDKQTWLVILRHAYQRSGDR